MKTYKEFMSESRFISEKFLKIAKAAFNDKVVKSLSKDSLRMANELPREIPNSMRTVSTGPFPKSEIDSHKGYLRNVRQGYIKPTPEPVKGMTGATSIGKPKQTGVAIHPDRKRLPKHEKSRGVKTKGVKTPPNIPSYFNPKGESDIMQYVKAKKSNDPDLDYYKAPILSRRMNTIISKNKRIKDTQDRLNKLYKKGDEK
tara:strand:- start:44 stop:643 length:600 start_codon:yes stop_codon:yes gene_type:complete